MTFTLPTFLFWMLTTLLPAVRAGDGGTGPMMYASIYRNVKTAAWTRQDLVLTGLAISGDRGKSWRSVGVRNAGVLDFFVDPADRSAILLACTNGLERSGDGGKSWKLVSPWYAAPVTKVLPLPGERHRFLIGAADGLYLFDAETESWKDASDGMRTPGERHINMLLAGGETLAAGTEDGIFLSTDRGASWRKIALEGMAVRSLARHPSRPDLWAAATAREGIFVSEDGGRTFEPRCSGLLGLQMFCVAFDPADARTLYCSGAGYGMYRSGDLGRHWDISSRGLTNFTVTALCVDPDDSRVVYAGTKSGTFVTRNKGERWESFTLPTAHVTSLRIE